MRSATRAAAAPMAMPAMAPPERLDSWEDVEPVVAGNEGAGLVVEANGEEDDEDEAADEEGLKSARSACRKATVMGCAYMVTGRGEDARRPVQAGREAIRLGERGAEAGARGERARAAEVVGRLGAGVDAVQLAGVLEVTAATRRSGERSRCLARGRTAIHVPGTTDRGRRRVVERLVGGRIPGRTGARAEKLDEGRRPPPFPRSRAAGRQSRPGRTARSRAEAHR
nr:hypothetical protein CFP56_00443 [Quercus suber]